VQFPSAAHYFTFFLIPISIAVSLLNITVYVGFGFARSSQVVAIALGCPNMPNAQVTDANGTDVAKSSIGASGYGVFFCAIEGAGAFAGSLTDDGAP
jgi:hypothetical protein